MTGLRRALVAAALALALTAAGCGLLPGTATSPAKVAVKPTAPSAESTPPVTVIPAAAVATPAAVARPASGTLVFSGDKSVKRVALTFDLCEIPGKPAGFDAKLVDELIAQQVPATFMMGGHWARTHATDARLLGSTPFFEIGNHAYAHKHPTRISTADFRDEIELAQRQIEEFAGVTPKVFRFPYGEHDAETLRTVAEAGLVPVQWNVETGDPDRNVSAKDILGVVRRQTRNGSIIIMHANGRGWHTAEALPGIVDWLHEQGYEIVTVGELLTPAQP